MSKHRTKNLNRRQFLTQLGVAGTGLSCLNIPFIGTPFAKANSGSEVKRVMQFFLVGGWDTGLATDPIIGSKASSNVYAGAYQNYQVSQVSGKANLQVGQGLAPAVSAFASMPTAFINGMHMEVTAHELAQNYMYSGVASLSRSREFPAFIARIATNTNAFPPFLAIGEPVPLGSTRDHPPLHAQSPNQLNEMLNPFDVGEVPEKVVGIAHDLLSKLDQNFKSSQSQNMQEYLQVWENSASRLDELYTRQYDLALDDSIKDRYQIGEVWEEFARIPTAFLALKSGLSPFITCSLNGYDTHINHFDQHIETMNGFASRLNTFVSDLSTTPDPDDSSKMLSETTLIVILSEFCRTPHLNAGQGTDHWQSASGIIMGPGVADNSIIGATDDNAKPLGWVSSSQTDLNDDTQILPDHFAKAIVKKVLPGLDTNSDLGDKSLDEVFS